MILKGRKTPQVTPYPLVPEEGHLHIGMVRKAQDTVVCTCFAQMHVPTPCPVQWGTRAESHSVQSQVWADRMWTPSRRQPVKQAFLTTDPMALHTRWQWSTISKKHPKHKQKQQWQTKLEPHEAAYAGHIACSVWASIGCMQNCWLASARAWIQWVLGWGPVTDFLHFPRLLQYKIKQVCVDYKWRYQNMSASCVVLGRADQGILHFRAPRWVWLAKTISLGSPAELAKLTFATSRIKDQDWDWLLPLKRT